MMMVSGRPLLLPVNPRFIALTMVVGLLVNMLLAQLGWHGLPDVLAIVLVFWNVHQPRRVGVMLAFVLGLALDVQESTLLGQNALSYVVLSSITLMVQRRLLLFPLFEQSLQVLPLFLLATLLEWATRLIVHGVWPHWSQALSPFIQAALWPLIGMLLLAPQRRALKPDNIRPL